MIFKEKTMMQSGIELENSKFIHCCSCKSMTGLEIIRKNKKQSHIEVRGFNVKP